MATKVPGYALAVKIGDKIIAGLITSGFKEKPNYEEVLHKEHAGVPDEDLDDSARELSCSGQTYRRTTGEAATYEDYETIREAAAAGSDIAFSYYNAQTESGYNSGVGKIIDFGEDANSKDTGTYSFTIKESSSQGAEWNYVTNLSLHFTGRNGTQIPNLKTPSLPAAILPAVGVFDGSKYLSRTVSNFASADASGYVEAKIYYETGTSLIVFCRANNTSTQIYASCLIASNGYPYIRVRNSGTSLYNNINGQTVLTQGWHTLRFGSTGSAYFIELDGVNQGLTVANGANNGAWINLAGLGHNIAIGAQLLFTPVYSSGTTNKISYVDYNGTHRWICSGTGKYCYDIIGSDHMTWTGTSHLAYDAQASLHLLDNGYSVWTKTGEADEYVPYTSGGTPIDVSAFLSGYTKARDHQGGSNIYNLGPALIDFDPGNSADSSLAVFNKANTTIHIASGSMDYYDPAETYRWRNDEIADPRIYLDEYNNVGYQGIMMARVSMSSLIILSISDLLVYTVDKREQDLWSLAQYCHVDPLVVTSGGEPVFDGNGYLVWV